MAQNYILLETIELTQSAASVTFDNIPQTGYTDLKLVLSARASASANWALIGINGGSDTATTLRHLLDNEGTPISQTYTSLRMLINGSTTTANTFSSSELYFSDYTSANQKTISGEGTQENGAVGGNRHIAAFLWPFTSAITSLTLTVDGGSSFVAGSTFSIYGIAALGTTPVTAPFASGGNIVANDGTYWYHAFLNSGTFTPLKALSCDYLVVAGGGSGGVGSGGGGGAGGGGAGGFRTSMGTQGGGASAGSPLSLTAIAYPVTVGAGAAAVSLGDRIDGLQGSDSIFSTITSTGGGFGSGASNGGVHPGGSGGSGGGASEWNRSSGTTSGGAAASPTQGYRGGNCAPTSPDRHGAGGGGAGAQGGDTVNAADGAGGNGLSISYVSTALINIPSTVAGGGGGSREGGGAAGGTGGGGAGLNSTASPQTGNSGTALTGSGGGGVGGNSGTLKTSGAGGSGIVVIRYPMV